MQAKFMKAKSMKGKLTEEILSYWYSPKIKQACMVRPHQDGNLLALPGWFQKPKAPGFLQ